MFYGLVSLSSDPTEQKPVRILRDTGDSQSFVLAEAVDIWGISGLTHFDTPKAGITNSVPKARELLVFHPPFTWESGASSLANQ